MDAVIAGIEKELIRCGCCIFVLDLSNREPNFAPFVETYDGRRWCPACAFGVLQSGYCTLHLNDVFPEVSAVTPRVSILTYPDEFVPRELKDKLAAKLAAKESK
jgi:hypothetical protein